MFDLRSKPEVDKGWAGITGEKEEGDVRPGWIKDMDDEGVKRSWVPVFEERDYSPERLAERYQQYMDESAEVRSIHVPCCLCPSQFSVFDFLFAFCVFIQSACAFDISISPSLHTVIFMFIPTHRANTTHFPTALRYTRASCTPTTIFCATPDPASVLSYSTSPTSHHPTRPRRPAH